MQSNKIESGVQLFSRVNRKTFLEDINPGFFPAGGPFVNQVIEVTGDRQTNISDVIMDFIAKCILPSEYNKEWKNSGAIFINTEFQINILKIIKYIDTLLVKKNIPDSKKIVEIALKNLTILNCYNMDELIVTFYYLEKIIQCNENINLIVIDNIAAHFWTSTLNSDTLNYYQHSLKMFKMLYNITKSLQVLLIFVRHDKTVNKRKFNSKIDFRIEVEKTEQVHKATITNYEKQTTTTVPFQSKITLEFII